MYPPRSRSRQKSKHTRKRRRRTAWTWINVSLLLLITAALSYYFISSNGSEDAAPPPQGEVLVSPSPDPTLAPTAVPTPEVTATPEHSVPVEAPEMSPSPVVDTPTEAPDAEPTTAPTEKPESDIDSSQGSGLASGLSDEDADGRTVTLNFAGDAIFSGKVGELLDKKGYAYSYAGLNGLFKQDDLTVLNLETPITTRGMAANKQYVFKGAPEALDALKAAGVDAVNLANNHTLDQGVQGLEDTLSNLSQRGIPYVGAGLTSKEAYSAQYFERNGIKIAVLGFTRVIPQSDWMAGVSSPGVATVYDSAEGLKAIAQAKKAADLVVVVVHWGKERVEQYDSIQQSLGHSFIDAGADLVIGGHPHVLQGIEPYKGKWIAYSTGNFIFTRSTVPATWKTAIFQAECTIKGQCSLQLKPMDAELAQSVPMNEVDGQLLLKRLESLSAGLITIGSDGKVKQVNR
ncbi:CapA family protein [Paenibacillus sp. 19GGS1-52]|uniref:CapA family protein n=1 Tax=Paenibacillus sp. 19GGS1-52 TaxID=2758563 RepID=UPI001EFB893A|nr:CapA family protein [Paenibacillus sp. 19GGS1-52]ULO05725.1 CapA family protein [Paenibacillus sp. 19GGS1-52]